jgi:hypothetical protein
MKNISMMFKNSFDNPSIQKQNIYKEFIIPNHIPCWGKILEIGYLTL